MLDIKRSLIGVTVDRPNPEVSKNENFDFLKTPISSIFAVDFLKILGAGLRDMSRFCQNWP